VALNTVAGEIRAAGARALAVPTDMGDERQVANLMTRILEAFGRLDVAFNNAGSGHRIRGRLRRSATSSSRPITGMRPCAPLWVLRPDR
jgi:NAD(P)-dependent dehydrogenase (short-subunit alcohol dehydrogenase family)